MGKNILVVRGGRLHCFCFSAVFPNDIFGAESLY